MIRYRLCFFISSNDIMKFYSKSTGTVSLSYYLKVYLKQTERKITKFFTLSEIKFFRTIKLYILRQLCVRLKFQTV